jgi:hypothetical protein
MKKKDASLELQDNIYNWIVSDFQQRSHSTTFQRQFSCQEEVTASIVQGSSIGPASYVVTAFYIDPISSVNAMTKFAEDTNLLAQRRTLSPASFKLTTLKDERKTKTWF